MPVTLSAAAIAELKSGRFAPLVLLDVQAGDATTYYWTNQAGSYTSRITGVAQVYKAWAIGVGPLSVSATSSTDAGDLRVQNVSGNTVERDLAAVLRDHEIDGALVILRVLTPQGLETLREFHLYLSQPDVQATEMVARLLQLSDPQRVDALARDFTEQCPWRYKSAQCGSASGLTTCNKTFANCATRVATERFMGITITPSPVSQGAL